MSEMPTIPSFNRLAGDAETFGIAEDPNSGSHSVQVHLVSNGGVYATRLIQQPTHFQTSNVASYALGGAGYKQFQPASTGSIKGSFCFSRAR